VDGSSLAGLLEKGKLKPRERLKICYEVACGVLAAHQQGIVHRDLKPANVMVAADGSAKVLDFGIAKVLGISERPGAAVALDPGPSAPASTKAGTPGYMSPEQGRGESIDHRADIWAFGGLLRDCFGGRGERTLSAQPTWKVRVEGALPLAQKRLERLANWCRQVDPGNRPVSMEIVCAELRRILRIHRVMARLRMWGWPAVGVLIAASVVFLLLRPSPVPVAVNPAGQSVEVRYSNGQTEFLLCRGSTSQDFDRALLVPFGPQGDQQMIAACTGSTTAELSRLFLWSADGRPLQIIPTTDDWPHLPAAGPLDMYSNKRWTWMFPPSEMQSRFIALEYSRYHPSVLRAFALASSEATETYRLYHSGHINSVRCSPGLEACERWMWFTGRVRDGGALIEAAGGIGGNTCFLACFPEDAQGTEVFPPWMELDPNFVARHHGEIRAANPIAYFVIRGYTTEHGRVGWDHAPSFFIDQVFTPDSETVGVLLGNTMRIDFHREATRRIRINATAGGDLPTVLTRRAKAIGDSSGRLVRDFLVDSVLVLVAAREGLDLVGDYRDVREKLPGR